MQTIQLQRLEGLATLICAVVLYASTGTSWWLFALLLLVPDVSMVGYLLGNRVGQTTYNIVHTYAVPMMLALAGLALRQPILISLSLIWLAHIGMDRAIGYGLKEAEGFRFTHLGAL